MSCPSTAAVAPGVCQRLPPGPGDPLLRPNIGAQVQPVGTTYRPSSPRFHARLTYILHTRARQGLQLNSGQTFHSLFLRYHRAHAGRTRGNMSGRPNPRNSRIAQHRYNGFFEINQSHPETPSVQSHRQAASYFWFSGRRELQSHACQQRAHS